jgi:hypothetical protein
MTPAGPGRLEDMRQLTANTFVSLDDWDEAMQELMGEVMGRPFDLVLGRRTYETRVWIFPVVLGVRGPPRPA